MLENGIQGQLSRFLYSDIYWVLLPPFLDKEADLISSLQWLDAFKKARGGDSKMQRTLERYGRLIEMKRKKEHWKQVLRIEMVCKSSSSCCETFRSSMSTIPTHL
jgi:hypothetical protein